MEEEEQGFGIGANGIVATEIAGAVGLQSSAIHLSNGRSR